MRAFKILVAIGLSLTIANISHGQSIIDHFDTQISGSPPTWLWWRSGSAGTIKVDDTVFAGQSGKSVEIARTSFNGRGFSFGRNFPPVEGTSRLLYSFRAGSTTEETLTAVGGNNAGHQVAWWVGVGGAAGNAIGTHSHSEGWNHLMDVETDTWYDVMIVVNPGSFTYDITVIERGAPANMVTEKDLPFRDGTAVKVIDQFQFGNFSDASAGPSAPAYVDDIHFSGAPLFSNGFESEITNPTVGQTVITSCGQVVTTDAILTDDLSCPSGEFESAAIEVGASNITIDLDGHVISGHPNGIGVKVEGFDGVTLRNGTIRDFMVGVNIFQASSITIADLWVGNLVEDDPEVFLPGIRITQSNNVFVRDCFFEFLPVFHKEAIVSAESEFVIDNIEVWHASVGVNFSGAGGSKGRVVNSRFQDVSISGILVYGTDNGLIADNEFGRCLINIDERIEGGVSGLTIERNLIYDWDMGIMFRGGRDSIVRDNRVHGHTWRGIMMDKNQTCPDPPNQDCFFATGNTITGNIATDNAIDLVHHPNAIGNTWANNVCDTTEGAEIPVCIPPTP